ncbi:MAG: acyl-CoA dehydrogenase family protein, partial [Anaerolineales bacterium]
MISFETPKSILETVTMIEALATEMMRPAARYYDDHEHETPWDYINFMQAALRAAGGLTMAPSPSTSDGATRENYQRLAHFIEALSWGDAGLYLCTPRGGLGAAAVSATGTPEQKGRFLERFNGEKPVFSSM